MECWGQCGSNLLTQFRFPVHGRQAELTPAHSDKSYFSTVDELDDSKDVAASAVSPVPGGLCDVGSPHDILADGSSGPSNSMFSLARSAEPMIHCCDIRTSCC